MSLVVSEHEQELTLSREGEVFNYLKQSKYRDVPEEHIHTLISYCRAARLDPLGEVAHIVGYNEQDKQTKEWRKTYKILPGIAKFRIQGYRSGTCMGVSIPEFGPMIEEKIGNATVKYPEWCIVRVKRLIHGQIAEFEAKEYWIENYASVNKSNPTPNSMWLRRPRGQLGKCTEAQGWRKGFPELTAGEITFEEMEGKWFAKEAMNQELIEEHNKDVVERIKVLRNSPLVSIQSPGFDPPVEQEAVEKEEPEKKELEEAIDPQISCLFDMLKGASEPIKKRVADYMESNSVITLNERRMKFLIKTIVSAFPETRRQLSPDHNKLIDKIMSE